MCVHSIKCYSSTDFYWNTKMLRIAAKNRYRFVCCIWAEFNVRETALIATVTNIIFKCDSQIPYESKRIHFVSRWTVQPRLFDCGGEWSSRRAGGRTQTHTHFAIVERSCWRPLESNEANWNCALAFFVKNTTVCWSFYSTTIIKFI